MKKSLVVLLVLFVSIPGGILVAQDGPSSLDDIRNELTGDLGVILTQIGIGIVPHLQQNALSANIVGDAELGNFPHFTITAVGVGLNTFSGIGTFLEPQDAWRYDEEPLFNIRKQILDSVGDYTEATDDDPESFDGDPAYRLFSRQIVPLPSVKVGLGIGLVRGYELLLSGMFVPEALLDRGRDFAEQQEIDALDNLSVGIENYSVRLRKVIVGREGRRGRSLSLGVGYTYSAFSFSYNIDSLTDLVDELPEIVEDEQWADIINTRFSVNTQLHTVGFDIHTSRRWPVATTFLQISPYYGWAKYRSSANVELVLMDDDPNVDYQLALNNADRERFPIRAEEAINNDLSVYVRSGLELRLLGIIFHTSVGLNLEDPLASLSNFDIRKLPGDPEGAVDGFDGKLNGVNVNVGLRFQY